MTAPIITLLIAVLAAIGGVWKYFGRIATEKRKLADVAKEKLDKAHETGNKSDYLDAWDNASRLQ